MSRFDNFQSKLIGGRFARENRMKRFVSFETDLPRD